MSERPYLPPRMDVTEEELAMLDVDFERPWHGVMGEVWSRPVGPVERLAGRVMRSAALARVLVVSPLMILAWIIASAVVFALGVVVTQATEQPLIPLLAPALAAVGVAYAYGAGADVAFEISRTMPVSSRMILLVRIAVVFAINTLFGAVASFFAPVLGGVTALWLLPMVAISMLGLAIATLTGLPALGGGVALLVWSGIVMRPVLEQRREDAAATVDLGNVVSESALMDHAPLYLAATVVCGAIVMWNNGAFGRTQEDARWHWR
jgi:hypothetical protein